MAFILTSLISSLCEEGQIDINSASLTELDEIYGIGPVKAQAIIDTRPFESINDLINVSGIGEITLDNITSQGLVCVAGEEETIDETLKEITQESIEEHIEDPDKELGGIKVSLTPEVISLTPKDIKSEENIESLDKTDYAKYGFIGFCILIGVLLVLKNRKRNKIA